MCYPATGGPISGHNVGTYADGVTCCALCGKQFPELGPEGFGVPKGSPGDRFCAEVAKRIQLIKPKWVSHGEFQECVSVYPKGANDNGICFWWGTANFVWGCDVYPNRTAHEAGNSTDSLEISANQREDNPAIVASEIVAVVERYVTSREFLEAQNEFMCAAAALNDAWQRLDQRDHAGDKLVLHYPFNESFAELVARMPEWCEETENNPNFGKTAKVKR